jgi:hemolysin D
VLEVEAMISNRDIGFVHVGQAAQIKVDTFNFTRYGLLGGRILSVSQDAIMREVPAGNTKNDTEAAESTSSEPTGQELSYAARVSLDRTQIQVDNAIANLSPGMAVTVEIKTGSRAVITYLLSPLLRYGHDSMRER